MTRNHLACIESSTYSSNRLSRSFLCPSLGCIPLALVACRGVGEYSVGQRIRLWFPTIFPPPNLRWTWAPVECFQSQGGFCQVFIAKRVRQPVVSASVPVPFVPQILHTGALLVFTECLSCEAIGWLCLGLTKEC